MASTTPAHWHELGEGAAAADRAGRRAGSGVFFLPDLASVAALLTFLYVLFVYQGYTRLFRDSDAGWHIRSGEAIWRNASLPRTDPYSFSLAGRSWMNWEWLPDLATGGAHRAAGPAGVAILYAAGVALAVWLWFRLQWRLGTNFLLAAALAIPLLGTLNIHYLARPHIWSWSLLLGALLLLEGGRTRARLAAYCALAALWANVHGSFVLAPVLALLYRSPFLAALAGAATLLNPYGWRLHHHVFGYLTDGRLLAQVGEYQSFNFHADGSGQILLALFLAAAGTFAAFARGRIDHFLVGVLFLGGGLRHARGLPLIALAVLPIAGAHLGHFWTRCTAFRDYGERLRAIDRRAASWLAVPLLAAAAVAAMPFVSPRAGFPATEFPVAAAARLEQLAPELFQGAGRLLAPDKFGGYLIYRFEGRLPVFFDGRSDFYGSAFLEEWRRLAQVRPGWGELIDKYRFTHALLPNDYSLVEALRRAGWEVLHQDATAILLRWNT
jgi:hypothetical protein